MTITLAQVQGAVKRNIEKYCEARPKPFSLGGGPYSAVLGGIPAVRSSA
jgi:hypothetical protein